MEDDEYERDDRDDAWDPFEEEAMLARIERRAADRARLDEQRAHDRALQRDTLDRLGGGDDGGV